LATLSSKGGRISGVHPLPRVRLQGLVVDGEELENGIKGLIIQERGSQAFEDLVREEILKRY
jgi:hypothetical protein